MGWLGRRVGFGKLNIQTLRELLQHHPLLLVRVVFIIIINIIYNINKLKVLSWK
jgi:hypothetical protein